LALKAADSGITAATAGLWPSLSANAGFNRSGASALSRSAAAELDGSSYSGSLNASWNLFNGFGTLYGRFAAMENYNQKKADYDLSSASVLQSLKQAFNQLLYDQKASLLLQDIATRYNRDTRYQELQFESGQTARWTFLKAQSDEAEVKWQVRQNELNLQADQAALASVLGMDLSKASSLLVDGVLDVPGPPSSDDADWAKISSSHPQVKLAKAQVAAAEDNLGGARASLYPDLSASGSYGESGANAWGPSERTWSAGLNLSFNLFAGGADLAQINQASANLEASHKDLENSLSQLQASLHKAWASYSSSFERLPVERLAMAAGEERFKTVQTLYQAGRAAFLDYEQAESIYTQAQQQELSADLSAAQSRAAYQNALGVTLEEAGP
jgi:outer membrane protein TolC